MDVEEGGKVHNFHGMGLTSSAVFVMKSGTLCFSKKTPFFAQFTLTSCVTGSQRTALLMQVAGVLGATSQVTAVPPGVLQGPLFPDRFYCWRPLAASAQSWCEVLPPL